MAFESQTRLQSYLKTGCNAFTNKRPISTPIAFWTDSDIWEYIKLNNVPYSAIYDLGYKRTGCMFCAYGCHLRGKRNNKFELMQTTHPKLYKYCMKKLGLQKVFEFIEQGLKNNKKD